MTLFMLLDILCSCSLEQPTETPTDFTRHFVAMFTSTTNTFTEKPALFHLTFCVYILLNCPQKNQHNLLDTLWWCSLEQPTEKLTYFAWHFVVMLLEPPTDKPTHFTWHFVFIFTWTAHRKNNIFYVTFCGHITWTSFREVNIFHVTLFLFIMFT